MTEYGLEPAFVKFDYTSAFGAHSHLICTKTWLPTSVTGTMGSYVAWNGTPCDAEAMIIAMTTQLAEQHQNTTTYNLATIFTKADESSPAIPVATKTLTSVGANTSAVHTRAIQKTMNFRTVGIHAAKLVFLDVPHGITDFNKQFPVDFSVAENDLVDVFDGDVWAWAGRDNTQILAPVSITWNLNQQLRKQYGMA
jgi:hypothetical protein